MPINLNINTNQIIVSSSQNQISVEDKNNGVVLNIEQPITKTIEVISSGPKGDKGDQGDSLFTDIGNNLYSTTSSLEITGSLSITQGITSSLQGTSSWAINSISSSQASTASLAPNYTLTSSFNAFTSSYNTGSFTGSFTGSLQGTASFAVSSSRAISSSFTTTASFAVSSSRAVSSSFATTASFVSSIAPNITNNVSNYILTATGGSNINGESNLTFNGTTLNIQGAVQQGGTAIGDYSHAEGFFTSAGGNYSHAEGFNTVAIGDYSHAEGLNTVTSGSYSHAEGSYTQAIEYSSHAEGSNTQAIGAISHAEGSNTQAIGAISHAEGNYTIASGDVSHAEGDNTQAIGNTSHAEGYSTIASGSYSHAEGNSTQAIGPGSHAEGSSTQAIGLSSHAEGDNTQAIGDYSHAEGVNTVSLGSYSHAEGSSTQAIGSYSHAEGIGTQAIGEYSHAEGYNTITSGSYQHVQGKFNIPLPDESAFIIGNGVDDNNRSNLVFASGSQFQVTGSVRTTSGFLLKDYTQPNYGVMSFDEYKEYASLVFRSYDETGEFGTAQLSINAEENIEITSYSQDASKNSSIHIADGDITLTNLTDSTGTSISSAVQLWKDHILLATNNDSTGENNSVSVYSNRTYTTKYIETDEGFIGNYLEVPSITGSLLGTASFATSASQAITSSYSNYAATASNAQNAQDILIYVKNTSGAQINKGLVVRISGATGDNALISTASYESDLVSANTLGITTQNIPNDSFGYVMTEGTLLGINTDTFTAGQLLYLGPTGSIIGTAPVAPLHNVRLGQVLRVQQNNGSMYVRIDNGYELGELHDIIDSTTTSSFGDLLIKSGSVWTNSKQLTGSYGLTGSLQATSFTGSLQGTASWAQNVPSSSLTGSFVTLDTVQTITGAKTFTPTANTTPLTISGYSLTGSNAQSLLDLSGTWNTTGTPTLIRANVTNTNSNANSLLINLQVSNINSFGVNRNGGIILGNESVRIMPTAAAFGSSNISGTNLEFVSMTSTQQFTNGAFMFRAGNTLTNTIGGSLIFTRATFAPTTSGAPYSILTLSSTINQTGTANGITRGLHINPTLTSAADWRSIEWSNNTGRGLYGSGSATNNIQGDIGLGLLTTPSAKLHVRGSGATSTTTALRVENSDSTISMAVLDNGNVGIGTTTPSEKLQIQDTAPILRIQSNTINNDSTLQLMETSILGAEIRYNGSSTNNLQFNINDGTGFITKMQLNRDSGILNVPASITIGENPQTFSKLSIKLDGDGQGILIDRGINSGTNSWNGLFFKSSNSVSQPKSAIVHERLGSWGVGTLHFLINNSETNNIGVDLSDARMSITKDGNVGIGTTTPSAKLHVKGSGATSSTNSLMVENSDGTTSIQVTDHGLLQHKSTTTQISAAFFPINTAIYTFPKLIGETFKVLYSVKDGSNIRGGEYLCIHNGTTVNTVHTFPTEFGDTSPISLGISISGNDVVIAANVLSGIWDIKLNVQIL